MVVFPDVSAEREYGAHGRIKLVLDEDQSAVSAGRPGAPRPTHKGAHPAVQQRQATPVSASIRRQPDCHKRAFTKSKPTRRPNWFSLILQI